MTNTPNTLAEEFPDKVAEISTLKENDPHFARLYDDYHEVNRAIHRAETFVEPTDEDYEEEMRKKRLLLKDQIWGMLQENAG